MGLIDDLAALGESEILELAQVRGYQRRINGKLTTVKEAQRGGPAKSAQAKPGDKPKVDDILSRKTPVQDLTDVQRYLLKQRAKAYKEIADRHKKIRGDITDEYSQARDVLLAASDYYDSLTSNEYSYADREALRLNMATKRLTLRNTVREKLRLQAEKPKYPDALPPSW